VALIEKYRGNAIAETAQINKLLTDAIDLCDQRNFLAHGPGGASIAAAANIEPERRDVYLQRVEAMLKVRGIFDDSDVRDVAQLALCGLTTRKQTDAA
jgi:hypothetical protein